MKIDNLYAFRQEIDEIDAKILALLSERFAVVTRVAAHKASHKLPARIPERIAEVCETREALGTSLGMPPLSAYNIYSKIVEESCLFEENLLK